MSLTQELWDKSISVSAKKWDEQKWEKKLEEKLELKKNQSCARASPVHLRLKKNECTTNESSSSATFMTWVFVGCVLEQN